MRSFLKVAVPVVMIGAVVAVIAYVTQNTARNPASIKINLGETKPVEGDVIIFDQDLLAAEGPERPMEVELASHQHKDFWFHTTQERDVQLTLYHKTCGCADVQLGTFSGMTDKEWKDLAAAPTLGALCHLLQSVKFEPLGEQKFNAVSTIPGTPPGQLPRPYVLRVNWSVKEPSNKDGNAALSVLVNAIVEGGAPQQRRCDVKFRVVPGTGFWPGNVDFGDLGPGSVSTRECVIWSQTRERLDFTPRITAAGDYKQSEPCAEISAPEKLSDQEMADLVKLLDPKKQLKISLSSAYRLHLTLRERKGDQQLEMGPFMRRLVIEYQTVPGEDALVRLQPNVSAYVRGEVNVLNGDDVGRVSLGTFRFDRPQKLDVRLGSTDSKLELEFDSCTHEKMHVTLGEPMNIERRREWIMHVELEGNALLGEFNHHVLLHVKGKPDRRLRIPISGSAVREQ
jgi:hypothetical protein